jgi:tRNA 2-thiouridine synthesizing protein A
MSESHAEDRAMVDVDATGLACPMPVIELARAIDTVQPGGRARLLATDIAAKIDVPVWCRMQRHRLVSMEEHTTDSTIWEFIVERRR